MKVAIIYTGMVRTMEKTLTHFKTNILLTPNHHVFAVLQSDNKDNDLLLLTNHVGHHLKSIEWFDKLDPIWIQLQQHLLNKMIISDGWKNYLGYGSGSMIEYYQMYLAYLAIEKYEKSNNMQYDYIIRTRADIVITRPICFLNNYNDEIVQKIMNKLKLLYPDHNNEQMVLLVMTSMIDTCRCHNNVKRCCYPSSLHYNNLITLSDNNFIKSLTNYLNQGDYLITLRENLIYYGPRHVFTKIYNLGIMYGKFKDHINPYWFNAESQLKANCAFYDIDIYDSHTEKEVKSLYHYDANDYFDDKGLKQDDDDVFFFIQRN